MVRNVRKWISLIAAVVLYYVIHEGAHLIFALLFGTFKKIQFVYWGIGIQIVVDAAVMSDMQLFVFGIAGVAATLIAGYIFVWKRNSILKSTSKVVRAVAYYSTLIFLCLDPFYLSILYRFVGGGDMNSIILIGIPKIAATIFFIILLAANLIIFIRIISPAYKKRFTEDQ
ncbi:hypothetical protein [Anaeropeptidivorans aminofermentans]|uniref:hypothetical protein n=1 Tax=Anaeropeptidivorans aminofermentans TaxID=2934315 RepID=UPI002023D56D|nr:hypothetical protein [Anaeropeptidivorans aminofermentans]MBE6012401.1 hypothetical protein [Lachnospiraceae bacterium]